MGVFVPWRSEDTLQEELVLSFHQCFFFKSAFLSFRIILSSDYITKLLSPLHKGHANVCIPVGFTFLI